MSKDQPRNGGLGEDGADSVDPYEYTESIVRDLAAQLGARLRDVRTDVAALQSALATLPETLKLEATSEALRDVQQQLAQLAATVSQQGTALQGQRSAVEAEVNAQLAQLAERVGAVEAYLGRKSPGTAAQRRARLLDDIARDYL